MRALVCLALVALVGAPIVSTAADPPQATQTTFDDWSISKMANGMDAYTVNDSGELLGEFCYYKTTTCEWQIGIHTACNKGSDGDVLANSEASATPLEVKCEGQVPGMPLLYAFVFTNWKLFESGITNSSRVGFAMPLASDQFTVIRFSLAGRTKAQQTMESRFFAKVKNSTVDQTM